MSCFEMAEEFEPGYGDYMTESERRRYDTAFSLWIEAFNARPIDPAEMRLQAFRMKIAHRDARERRAKVK